MNKNQIIISLAAIIFSALFFLLPRYVVQSDNKQVGQKSEQKKQENEQENSAEGHAANISEEDKAKLADLMAKKSLQNEKTLADWSDSVVLLLQRAGLYDSAASWTESLLKENQKAKFLREKVGDAYYQAGIFSTKPEKAEKLFEKARSFFEEILNEDPKNLDAKTRLGLTYLSSQPMKGITLIRDEVLAENPNHLFALRSMGLLSMQSGQYEKAIPRFEHYLSLKESDAEVTLYLAVAQAESKKKDEARKGFEKVLSMTDDPALRSAAKDYLKNLGK
jgi:tetratricopeptide (TPR) repeat protein